MTNSSMRLNPSSSGSDSRETLMLLQRVELLQRELQRRTERRKITTYYPDSGPLRRELYSKHVQFFEAGTVSKVRLAMCANRVGKTEGMGGCETTYHLTGRYPDWWTGHRFSKPPVAWIAGETSKDVRDSIQFKLLGRPGQEGTGLIPGDLIKRRTAKTGIPDAVDTFYVQHVNGTSSCTFKGYEQGRESFQAADVDWMWFDEEPPLDVFIEGLTRTTTTRGKVIITFTPLKGMSETVLHLLPGGTIQERATEAVSVITCTWDDVPHLDEDEKRAQLALYPPYLRDAKTKGIPQLGSGAIYPVPESDLLAAPFSVPVHWPRGYGMDVGWNYTAAVWGAHDRENDVLYLTDAYKRSQAEPAVHASGIRSRGDWMHGFIDPASMGSNQMDGRDLFTEYRKLGLQIKTADNGVESGLFAVWHRMSTGRLKIFNHLSAWLEEFRLYRRDEKGRVVKDNDHLMDATRYLESRVMSMQVEPPKEAPPVNYSQYGSESWMA